MSETAGIHVLHVDDEPDFVEVTADILEREDSLFSVETATSASAGLDRVAADDFDCIVSDYQMPGQNGIEFLDAIRDEYPDLPFILYTGKGSEEVASEAIATGATDYLQKGHGTDQYGLLANRIQNAVEQYRAQRRATELDRIRTLAREINQALVHADSRSVAETRVCEIISDSDPYRFAWIGEIDPGTQRIESRVSAGVEEEYLENITVTADDTPTGHGPGGTAIRERRVAVSQNIHGDPEFEPWRDEALERGYRAVAAVPLEHGDTLYGELVVYADRPHAFDETERELLADLGSDIGHAIHSLEIQDKLREERDRRQALFENTPSPVIAGEECDTKCRISDVNDAFEEVFGYGSGEVIGRDTAEAIIPDDGIADYEECYESAMDGETITTEAERITADGLRKFLLHVIPYGMGGDRPDGTYTWYTDITDRKQREQQLDRANTMLRTVVENIPMGVLVEGAERDILMANDRLGEILGVPLAGDELIGRDCDTVAEKIQDRFADPAGFVNGQDTRIEQREPVHNEEIRLADGRVLERDYLPYSLLEGEANLWLYRDITDRKEHERELTEHYQELEEREEQFKTLHSAGKQLMQATSQEEAAEITIDTAKNVLGYARPSLRLVDEDETALRVVATTEENVAAAGERPDYWVNEDSPAARTYRRQEPEVYDDLNDTEDEYNRGTLRSGLYVPVGNHGVFSCGNPEPDVYDETDVNIIEVLMDLTATALTRIESERELRQKNKRLDKFASIVSHDLRSPLEVAMGQVELARDECDSPHLERATTAHDRIAAIIEDTLTLSRLGKTVEDKQDIELKKFVYDCWELVETGSITFDPPPAPVQIRADPDRLKQVCENLFRNAAEHAGEGVTVSVDRLEDGFAISDDGPGLPDDVDIFETGKTTSAEGTGFGLSIVEEIVTAHGWEIRATESETGGATFEITGVEFADE